MLFHKQDLYKLIEDVLSQIDKLDPGPGKDQDAFADQLRQIRPELFAELDGGPTGVVARKASAAIASAILRLIKDIPVISEAMLHAIDRRNTDAPVRCALAGALAYLVRLDDLLQDDLPGGFGFVDDCLILRAVATEFLDFLPTGFTTAERERRILDLLTICVPRARISEFQNAIEEIWLTFHVLLWESEDVAQELGDQLIEEPLDTPLPQPERESIPLPPGPCLSVAQGEDSLSIVGKLVAVRFARGVTMLVDENGEITQWE